MGEKYERRIKRKLEYIDLLGVAVVAERSGCIDPFLVSFYSNLNLNDDKIKI